MEIRQLPAADIGKIAEIDRSKYVDYAYRAEQGTLKRINVAWDIPTFRQNGDGPHSVQSHIETWTEVLANGGILFGALDGDTTAGLAIVVPKFEPEVAWLAYLHIHRNHRRQGVGAALWTASVALAKDSGARAIYISAIPSGPAVDFYRKQGCRLASPPHSKLLADEPEDIHLICDL